jgi:hypothetical protein
MESSRSGQVLGAKGPFIPRGMQNERITMDRRKKVAGERGFVIGGAAGHQKEDLAGL